MSDVQTDPWWPLSAVLAGHDAAGVSEGHALDAGGGVGFEPIESDRNLWRVWHGDTNLVTVDADEFVSTTQLGAYVDEIVEADQELAELERESDGGPEPVSFQ